jgi:monoterpene epsilon-lactone hydrolase
MKWFCGLLLISSVVSAQSATRVAANATPVHVDSSLIGPDGNDYVTRVVPVPATISAQARINLAHQEPDAYRAQTIAEQRHAVDVWQAGAEKAFHAIYPGKVTMASIAGVPVRIAVPPSIPAGHRDYVLLNVHGGGFIVDSGSLTESIPMAGLTRTRVVSVLYPLAPEHPFPAALDAAVAVYQGLLKTVKPDHIVIYGTSAGAILTAEIAVELKKRHLPEPAALGVFSGLGDFSRRGDSMALFGLNGLAGYVEQPTPGQPMSPEYVRNTDPRNPVLSPVFADLRGLPPTLFITSTRDMLLSGTTILERAFRHAGVDTRLIVFEALPHTFWNDPGLSESGEAHHDMAEFFIRHLYGASEPASASTADRH